MKRSLALVSLLLACGSSARGSHSDLAALRDRAARSPDDLSAQRDRALAELVAPGGDRAVAEREIQSLATRAASDPRVRFAEGVVAAQHGDFERALTAFLAAIDGARTSTDALAPAIAEASVAKVISLRGDVRDFETPFRELVDRAVREPGRLGSAARVELLETAVRWAREKGDRDAAARWTEATGCVTAWTVAGPFGPLPLLNFDRTFPPESTGPLASSYDVGPGRGRRPVYTVRARGCAANLGHGVTQTGVLYASSDLRVERDTDAVVQVESPNPFAVIVDGVTVATVDPRRRVTSSVTHTAVRLTAGVHTLRVKVASEFHSPLVVAMVTDRAGRPIGTWQPASAGAHPVPPQVLGTESAPADDAYGAARAALDPYTRYVQAELAFSRRNPVAARELLLPIGTAADATATTLIAWGSVALADPFLPSSEARGRAHRAFEKAAERDPQAYFPRLQLARLAQEDERPDEALALLRAADQRHANNPEIEAELADRLMQRNWDGEAKAVLVRAHARTPNACWHTRMLFTLAQRHQDGTLERELAEDIRRCDALSDAAATTLSRMRRWGEAETEYLRLVADDPEGRGLRRSLVELARARGEHSEAARRAEALLADMPEDDGLRADLVDLHVAAGESAEARALLDRELARSPAELAALFRMRSVLERRDDLEPWRLDGRAQLREFEASGHTYESSAVLVLDYTVRRNYADGSALELTHNVIKIQSQEAVEEYGEFTPPAGAALMRVRTLKADGRILEPESVAGKESLSLPELRPGDAVEFEYVRALSTNDLAPGGFVGDRFYFRGFEVPYDRSEYVVVTPREMPVVVDPRGEAPTLVRTDRGALIEHRWVARQSDRMSPEPRSVAAREFIPSVSAGSGATWNRFVDALRERLADQDVADPAAVREARAIVGDASAPSAKLTRLHHWVLEHIQQEGGGTPFESAPRMLAAHQGHRTRVLCYLLNLQGVPCEMALVRQGSADATVSELADDDTYQSIMLRVRTEQGERWVTAADHNAPVSYIPPAVAGGEAIVLAEGAARTRLPPLDLNAHGRSLRVDLALNADGSARATVEERLRGYAATGAREALRRMDAANRDRQFEAYIGAMVAGASLDTVQVEGVTDPEAEMVFRYTFSAPGVANVSRGRLVFDGIFHAEAARTYAELPERTVPLWNGDPVRATLDLRVTLPDGAQLEDLPSPAEGEAPGVRWSLRWERTPEGFHHVRQVNVPTGRVSVGDYGVFAASVRALDTADTNRVVARLR